MAGGETAPRAWIDEEEAPAGQETERGRGRQGGGKEGHGKNEGSETFLQALPSPTPFMD